MKPSRDPPTLRFKRPGRTLKNKRQHVISPIRTKTVTYDLSTSWRSAQLDQLPDLFATTTNECQQLLQHLQQLKEAKEAAKIAHHQYLKRQAMMKLTTMVINWRKKRWRRQYNLDKSANVIQKKFRFQMQQQQYLKNIMSRKIQARHRGQRDRRLAEKKRLLYTTCSVIIQCAWRCTIAKRIASKLLPLSTRIRLKHNRRMAAITLQHWFNTFKWKLIHSDKYRRKLKRYRKQRKKRNSYGGIRRSGNRTKKKIPMKSKNSKNSIVEPTPAKIKDSSDIVGESIPTKIDLITQPTQPKSIRGIGKPEPETIIIIKKTEVKKEVYQMSDFPQDNELYVNHDRVLFNKNRKQVSKILESYDRRIQESNNNR